MRTPHLMFLRAEDAMRAPSTQVQEKSRTFFDRYPDLQQHVYFEAYCHRFPFCSCLSDPLIHHGRHFGRSLHALCNIQSLITNGILRTIELDDDPELAGTLTVE